MNNLETEIQIPISETGNEIPISKTPDTPETKEEQKRKPWWEIITSGNDGSSKAKERAAHVLKLKNRIFEIIEVDPQTPLCDVVDRTKCDKKLEFARNIMGKFRVKEKDVDVTAIHKIFQGSSKLTVGEFVERLAQLMEPLKEKRVESFGIARLIAILAKGLDTTKIGEINGFEDYFGDGFEDYFEDDDFANNSKVPPVDKGESPEWQARRKHLLDLIGKKNA